MMNVLLALIGNIVSGIFAAGAIYLASKGMEGWGWCIVAAILCSASTSISN